MAHLKDVNKPDLVLLVTPVADEVRATVEALASEKRQLKAPVVAVVAGKCETLTVRALAEVTLMDEGVTEATAGQGVAEVDHAKVEFASAKVALGVAHLAWVVQAALITHHPHSL